jgi:HlyD family secretion protein
VRRVLLPIVVVIGVGFLFLCTLGFLVYESRPEAEVVEITTPEVGDLVLKTVATGAIVPRVEIEIKSRVSGVVDALHVEPGAAVKAGDLIAEIRVIPDSASLNQAESGVKSAKIELDNARVELERATALSESAALSAAELQRARTDYELARQEHDAARSHLQIVREGATRGGGNLSTEVRSTVDGMVLAVPVEEGESVTETNTFNAGTTIATVADMSDMVFEGTVDESEVGRLHEGVDLEVTVGALQDQRFSGKLEYISPKGVVTDGTVTFEIRAALDEREDVFVRAGSSANADIVLDRREQVLTIDEGALRFADGEPYVEVEVSEGVFERRDVELGLSDGLRIEVLSGLEGDERLDGGPASAEESRGWSGGRRGPRRR